MKAILLLTLIVSASAIPFLERLNRDGVLTIKEAVLENIRSEDMNAPEHMSWNLLAEETKLIEEDYSAPEHMSWVIPENEEIISRRDQVFGRLQKMLDERLKK
jgi:hypothetical protein